MALDIVENILKAGDEAKVMRKKIIENQISGGVNSYVSKVEAGLLDKIESLSSQQNSAISDKANNVIKSYFSDEE